LLSKRSIRNRFLLLLFIASTVLIVLFSSILYIYIKQSILDEKKDELLSLAQDIKNNDAIGDTLFLESDALLGVSVEMVIMKIKYEKTLTRYLQYDDRYFISIIHPYKIEEGRYLKISKDITATMILFDRILNSILVINFIALFLILIYAIALSKMLIKPITALTSRLSNMNENFITPINIDTLPIEFYPLGEGINKLIFRIQTFLKYQKELFIGTAHELKTPLAVMKLKNQVTSIKERTPQEYIDAIKISNETIDEMNKKIGDILNIGRQEGAQFEKPENIDIVEFLKAKGKDFVMLAKSENKILELDFIVDHFKATIQPTLLNQIIQNFLQNAIKFTPENQKIVFRAQLLKRDKKLLIEIVDEGCGIDESIDLFAPFKRVGDKSGVGLGLFLAKSAADAMGIQISIKNRDDRSGTIASIELSDEMCCSLNDDK